MANTPFGTLVRRAEQTPGSWSGGTTLAIYAEPHDSVRSAASARIWIGTATIEHAADFSFFPGQMRVHVPIKGHGVRLRFQAPAETVTLPTVGLPALIEKEERFLASLVAMHISRATSFVVDGDRAAINWVFEFTAANGQRMHMDEIAYQLWDGDKIVRERYYYDTASLGMI